MSRTSTLKSQQIENNKTPERQQEFVVLREILKRSVTTEIDSGEL
jgi:hypothetical protein